MIRKLVQAMMGLRPRHSSVERAERLEIRTFRVNNERNMHVIMHAPDGTSRNKVIATGLSDREAHRLLERTQEHLNDFLTDGLTPGH